MLRAWKRTSQYGRRFKAFIPVKRLKPSSGSLGTKFNKPSVIIFDPNCYIVIGLYGLQGKQGTFHLTHPYYWFRKVLTWIHFQVILMQTSNVQGARNFVSSDGYSHTVCRVMIKLNSISMPIPLSPQLCLGSWLFRFPDWEFRTWLQATRNSQKR